MRPIANEIAVTADQVVNDRATTIKSKLLLGLSGREYLAKGDQ